jgi:hypothetical protein
MSTDPLPELLTIPQICRRLPGARGARHVNPSTVARWILTGCPARDGTRVRLTAIRCGGRWLVRPDDLDTFFAMLGGDPASASPPAVATPPAPTPAARRRATEAALHKLEAAGA